LADELGALLKRRKLTMATAESCTGGWIAKLVTDVPGSSAWFERGYVTYSNAAKVDQLGVREETLRNEGAVSHAVVAEMAEGALTGSHADLAVAVSGVAGPDGGTPDKPVGMVWLAWSRRGGETEAECHQFTGDRRTVRLQAVRTALQGLIQRLERGG
jgi:nicotinamide-nucleotide amidase